MISLEVLQLEKISSGLSVTCVRGEDLDFLIANLGLLWRLSIRSFTISAVRILKKPCAIELNIVKFSFSLYLIVIVSYSLMMRVSVGCMKRNIENIFHVGLKCIIGIRIMQ